MNYNGTARMSDPSLFYLTKSIRDEQFIQTKKDICCILPFACFLLLQTS